MPLLTAIMTKFRQVVEATKKLLEPRGWRHVSKKIHPIDEARFCVCWALQGRLWTLTEEYYVEYLAEAHRR